jgi:SpoVK/Ycf46/Vps4 family AAA+-type ATPase
MKTEGIINKAMDGVLFIDEAYSLAPQNSEDSYGEEAINVLLKRMEDDRDRFVVIVAGYGEEMHEFIDSNPGLSSRFARYIEFPNYSDLCQKRLLSWRWHGRCFTSALRLGSIQRRPKIWQCPIRPKPV